MTARMSSVYQLRMRTLRRLKSQRILCLGVISAAVLTLASTYQSSGSAHAIVTLRSFRMQECEMHDNMGVYTNDHIL